MCLSSRAGEPRTAVADLRYGTALYEYYQGHYFEALSELLVAEARGGITGHGENPALVTGGISLSYGMEQRAADIFSTLLADNNGSGEHPLEVRNNGDAEQPLEVRNAAWFYLARLRYLQGKWDGAAASLDRIGGRFDEQLLPQLEAMAINLAIRNNDLPSAAAQLENVRYANGQLHYLYYNLASAYSRAGDDRRANDYYRRLAALPLSERPAQREEQLALYDKAMTAAGYNHLLQGRYTAAIEQFKTVRLESPFSNRALLGYGWAAVENQDYRLALQPWQALSERSLLHAPVQEAKLAVPYTYEKLGARGEALHAYLDAETGFQAEIARIDQAIAELDQLDVIAALNSRQTADRSWFLLDQTSAAEPHRAYLSQLFSTNRFQGAVRELRDLLDLNSRLRDWRQRLDMYEHLLQQRQADRERQLATFAQRDLANELNVMLATRARLNRQLERIAGEKDYFAMATEKERTLVDAIESAQAAIDALKRAGEPTEVYEALIRRYRGLLYWQASEAFPERQRALRRGIRQVDLTVQQAQDNLERLRGLVVAARLAPDRIDRLRERLDRQSERVSVALGRAENSLRSQIAGELIARRDRLQDYLAQARLAVARLYDSSLQEQQP